MLTNNTAKHAHLGGRRAWQGWWLGGLLAVMAAGGAAGASPKQVLLLHSYGREFAPFNTFSETFRTTLGEQLNGPVEFHDLALESARFEGEASEGPLVDYLNTLFATRRLDLVVTIGGPAALFAQKYRPRLFPTTPMLIAAVDERLVKTLALTTNDAVVAVANEPARAMETMLRVLPETTNVLVVLGSSPVEKFWLGELRREFQAFTNRVSFVWCDDLTFAELQKRAAALPPQSAIYYTIFSVDAEGVPYVEERALRRLHDVANAPIFGVHDNQLGLGIVGGPMLLIEEIGRNTAKVAVRILQGEPAGSIHTPTSVLGRPLYDWRELQRWHISESRLPAGSMIRFRQPTAWDQYKWRIIGVLAICLLEALLIALLLLNQVRRRRAERALRESEERMSLATAAADMGIWAWDMHNNRVWVSANWRRMFGVPADADIGFETVFERVHEEDREAMELSVRRTVEGEADYVAEYRLKRPDGTQRWIAARGRLHSSGKVKHDRLVGVSVDITERKQAEQALRQSEERLSLAVAAAGVGVWEWDVAQNRFWATEESLHIFGFRSGEITSPNQMFQRLHPEDRAMVEHNMRRAIVDHADYKGEYRVVLLDHTERWIASQGRLHLEPDAKARRMLGAAIDITDRKRAIESLRRLQQQNELLLTSAAEGILGLDLQGNHTFVNPAASRMLGYTPKELLRRNAHDTWHHTRQDGSPHPNEECLICTALRDGAVRGVSNEVFWRKDGTSFPVEYTSTPIIQQDRPVGAVVTFQDVTERKVAEQALRQSEERLRLVLEANSEGVWDWNLPSGKAFFSPRYSAMLGYEPEEFAKDYDAWKALVHPDDFERVNAEHAAHIHQGKEFCVELRMRKKSGDWCWIRSRGTIVERDAEGRAIRMVGTHEDITERKQTEAEVVRQRAELAHVARVSTMGELAASVAHELNQPLGAILANAEAAELFLQHDPPALDDLRAILADIRKDDERAGEVIRRMRALLSKRALERQPLEINSLVEEVLQLVSGDAALRGIALRAELVPVLPQIAGDRVHLQQVLLNLILNGMDAMAAQPREQRQILVRTRLGADGGVELAVIDSGHGIGPDNLARLFEPFYTTKPNGMGMGLSIAHTIIEAHGGRIWAENRAEGGAVFRIKLPVSCEAAVTSNQ